MKKYYVLIGPPGAGKGTQAELLSQKKKLYLVQPGNLLRPEIKKKTKLGRLVNNFVKAGKLVPDEIINPIIFERLKKTRRDVLLDGFPRNLSQAKLLYSHVLEKNIQMFIVEIILDKSIILERISGRRSCSCGATYHVKFNLPRKADHCDKCGKKLFIRSDSRPDVIKQRVGVYQRQTKPVMKFFRGLKVVKYISVKGNDDYKKINQSILRKINQSL